MINKDFKTTHIYDLYGGSLSTLTSKGYIFKPSINDGDVFLIGPIDELGVMAVIGQDEEGFAIYLNDGENSDIFIKMDRLILIDGK